MDFKFDLKPKPTRPTKEELEMIAALAKKLPPVTDAKVVETSGAKLLKQGFKEFDNGSTIVKGMRYKFKVLVKVDHHSYILKLFKQFGLPGVQAYVEFVKQVYIKQLELLEEKGVTELNQLVSNNEGADQEPGPPQRDENNPT